MLRLCGRYVGPFGAYVGPRWPILLHKIEKIGKPRNTVNCGGLYRRRWGGQGLRRRPLSPMERRGEKACGNATARERREGLRQCHGHEGFGPLAINIHTYIHTCMHACMHACIHSFIHYIHTYIHYITLHYVTLHYITLHYTTLHYITLHHITYIHTYIHTTNTQTYITNNKLQVTNYIHANIHTHACMCIHIQTYKHACMHAYIHTYIHTYIHQTYKHT